MNKLELKHLPALSVRQPWSYLICAGIKPIENRTWKLPEKYKGKRLLIHAGGLVDKSAVDKISLIDGELARKIWFEINNNKLPLGAIIGSVEIVDCVINHPSIWAEKETHVDKFFGTPVYNWVLKNPVLFEEPILNVKGALSFFKPKID